MYANGEGVVEDDAEAVRWLRLAADQGHAGAQYNLGVMYADGEGVPEDDAEAAGWLRLGRRSGARRSPVQPRYEVRLRRGCGGR